jgi:putative transposase
MSYDPSRHHRRSIRLPGYDYAKAGAYFITVCAHNRASLFGSIQGDEMIANDAGDMLNTMWDAFTVRFPHVSIDASVVMPNHIHAILVLADAATADGDIGEPSRQDVGTIIGRWKSLTTHEYLRGIRESDWLPFEKRLWQRNFWEHVIRNEDELDRLRSYIAANPARWAADKLHPSAPPVGIGTL